MKSKEERIMPIAILVTLAVYEDGCFYEYNIWQDSIWAEPILIVYYEDVTTEAYSVWNKL